MKKYKPSVMWAVVADNWKCQTIAGASLGFGQAVEDKEERLYGVYYIALFRTRTLARKRIKEVAEEWPGLRVIKVQVSEV